MRSQLKASYDFDGNLNYIDDTLKGQVAAKYQELTKQDKVFKGNSVLEVKADIFSYKLLLDGQVILNCSTFAIIGSKISLLPFLLFFIIFAAIFLKKHTIEKENLPQLDFSQIKRYPEASFNVHKVLTRESSRDNIR